MLNRIRLLSLLLGAQVVLAIALLWQDAGVTGTAAGQPLLDFDAAVVDEIEISGVEQSMTLKKQGDGWLLPQLENFPADAAKVTRLLSTLRGLTAGHTIATTAEAAQRFKVADDDFVRRLRLKQGEQLVAELYLGEASGVRRVHARVAGSAQVHALDFALHQAGEAPSSWWDRNYLYRDEAALQAIQLGPVRLQKTGDEWSLARLAEGEEMDKTAIVDLVRRVTRLGYQEVVTDASRLLGNVLMRLVFETASGPVEYAFHATGEEADPILTIEGQPYGLRIARYLFDELAKATRKGLLQPLEPTETAQSPSLQTD